MTDEVVQFLIDTYSAEQIAGFRQQCFEAHMAGLITDVQITATSQDGRSASGTITVGPADRLIFMAQCRQAIAALENDGTVVPESNGYGVDFRHRWTAT